MRDPQKSLRDWTKQDWMTSGTYKTGKDVKSEGKKRYLPKSAWASLSASEKSATNKAKADGNKKGKQFVSQPESIKNKTKKYR